MSHQSQLEKPKYRNWVRGALAYKYLKEGIEEFADDFFQKEHARILGLVNNTSGTACNHCRLELLLQKRKCKKMCNIIVVEIEKSFVSKVPKEKPNWKNIEIKKLYTSTWEVAKCFINAPGYSKTEKAADVDASGLLLLFIYNKNLQLSGNMTETGVNILKECRDRRNDLFHSPEMELEDDEMKKCIDDIKAILENHTELALTEKAKQNVSNLQQLKQQDFIITTHNEAEVHRDVLAFITRKEIELKDIIQEATDEIYRKQDDAFKAIDDKLQTDLQDALAENSDIKYLHKSVEILFQIVDNIKGDMRQMKKHLEEIDKDIGELKAVKDLHMEKLKYIEQKQVLQDGLVKLYQRHYVQTSLSPLKRQENDINIDNVYVEPEMVVVEDDKQQSGADNSRRKTSKQVERSIHGYHDLFHSGGRENKVIYIVGDVGAGKSSYCQMMIQDWCKAVTENSDQNATTQISSGSTKDRNIEELKKFDVLFCLSFKRMKGFSNITEMIKAVVKAGGLTKVNFINEIFEQDSERCLILADGLDEWTPPDTPSVLQHVVPGLPERGITNNATMVTFSRPSAKGILNLASSEWDLRLELVGINISNVADLVKKYLSKLQNTDKSMVENTDKSVDKFMNTIIALELGHLESCPLLLQQLVWLYCKGYEIGKSHFDVYCQIVNCMLSWSENKGENLGNDYNKAANTKQVQLPVSLRNFESFIKQKRYVLILGQVAFESLTAEKSSSTFSRSSFFETDIDKLIELGILVEENCYDPTHARTQLSFLHISYLEFFAAVYASCQFDEQQSDTNASVLTKIFQNCKTAADILQLSNLLKMICGLCPFVIRQVSLFISDTVKGDEKLRPEFDLGNIVTKKQIQLLTMSLLSECDTNDKMINLSEVIIDKSTKMSAIRSIIPDNVRTCDLLFCSNEVILKWMTQLKHLQYLFIFKCFISHDQMTMLCSFIQEAPLRCISLYNVKCQQQDCRGHSIDLSKHDHLQELTIRDCDKIKISNINTEHLEKIYLESTQTLDIGFLQNSRRLRELNVGIFEGFLQTSHPRLIYNKDFASVVHTLHQLQTLTLSRASIDENALTVTSEMRNLKRIELSRVEMSQKTWRSFVDSLLTLQQSVKVDETRCFHSSFDIGIKYQKEQMKYIEEKGNMFEIIENKAKKPYLIVSGQESIKRMNIISYIKH